MANISGLQSKSTKVSTAWACYNTNGSSQPGGSDIFIGPLLRDSSGTLPFHLSSTNFIADVPCMLNLNHWQYITNIAAGCNMLISIRLNGNNIAQTQYYNSSGQIVNYSLTCSQTYKLAVGDIVQFVIFGSGSYTISGGSASAITLSCVS